MRKSKLSTVSASDAEHVIPDLKSAGTEIPLVSPLPSEKPESKYPWKHLDNAARDYLLRTNLPPGTRFEDAYPQALDQAMLSMDASRERSQGVDNLVERDRVAAEEEHQADLDKYGRVIPDVMELDEAAIFITSTKRPSPKANKSWVTVALNKLGNQGWRMMLDKVQTRTGAYQLIPIVFHPGERLVFHFVYNNMLLRHQVIEFREHYQAIQKRRRYRRQKQHVIADKKLFRKAG